jgi:Flp pilus assembly protein TadB
MIVPVILFLALVLLGIGALLAALLIAHSARRRPRQRTSRVRDAATTDWRTLQAANRISHAFWEAREAMRREAQRGLYDNDYVLRRDDYLR